MSPFLISALIILSIILILLIVIGMIVKSYLNKGKSFLRQYFGTSDLKEVLRQTKLDEENTPKSLSSMDSIYVPRIKKDFPELNINELRRISEKDIIYYLNSIEQGYLEKDSEVILSDKVVSSIKSQISDFTDKNVRFDSIKIHRTAISAYSYDGYVATINFNSSVEYVFGLNGESKKVQTKFKTEFIYIVDTEKLPSNIKGLGLNCPNCGAPIKSVGHKKCSYCGSGVVDIVKRNWILNDIRKY